MRWRHEHGVLRQTSLAAGDATVRAAADVAWLHGFLGTLALTGAHHDAVAELFAAT